MTKRFWSVNLSALACMVLSAGIVSAQQTQTPQTPAPPMASVAQLPPVDKYIPGAAKPPAVAGSPAIDLTLEQATQMALEKNLDLQVAKMNPQLQDYSLVIAHAAFRPTITGSFQQNHSSSISTSLLDATTTNININGSQTYRSAISQRMPWQGGSASATFTSGRSANNSQNSTRNPSLTAGINFSYTQPILANRVIDSARNAIRTQEITRQITDIQLLTTIENTKASVRTAYWALRQAIESIEIQNRSLNLAKQLLENDKIQVQIGTMAEIDTASPDASVAQAEVNVLNAQIAWQQADLTLKRLLVNGKDDDLYKRTINPVDQALLGLEPTVNIDGAVQTALANRTDIATSRKNIESSRISLELTKNGTLPQLDLSAGYGLSGTGGPAIKNGVVTTPGGYFDALGTLTNAPSWNLGLTFTYPLGMTVAHANLSRSQLQLEQSLASLKVTELTVSTDVTNAGLAVQNSYQRYVASKKSRELQEKNADAEQTRFSVGMSNNYNVVQAQNNLTSARLQELQALIAYINAVADFEKKQRIGG